METPATNAPAPAAPNAAPGDLELVREFANTLDVDDATDALVKGDDLESPELLRRWLLDRKLISPRDEVTAADLKNAVELRGAIRELALANHGEPVPPAALKVLERAAERSRLSPRFHAGAGPTLEPQVPGADAVLGRVVATIFEAMREGAWHRLKICRSDTCQWVFWDKSKNQSRAWCSMQVCGNRAKVKSYRRRATRGARSTT